MRWDQPKPTINIAKEQTNSIASNSRWLGVILSALVGAGIVFAVALIKKAIYGELFAIREVWFFASFGFFIGGVGSIFYSRHTARLLEMNVQLEREITQRVQMEHQLRYSESLFRAIAELVTDAAFSISIDPDGRFIVDWNSETLGQFVDFSSEYVQNIAWTKWIDQRDLAYVESLRVEALAGHPQVGEFRIYDPDGGMLWVHSYLQPVWDEEQQRVVRLYGAIQDVTERKQGEEERRQLIETERKLRLRSETLRQVANALSRSLDREQVLALLLDFLAQVILYDSVAVLLLDGQSLHIVAQQGVSSTPAQQATLDLSVYPNLRTVIESRCPLIIADTNQDKLWIPREDSAYARCWMGVPLLIQDQVIGLLALDREQPQSYTSRDAELAQAFADQAAIAIENTRLYEQARRDAETKTVLLAEVNHRVKNNLAAVLGLLYSERRRLPAVQGSLSRFNGSCQDVLQNLIIKVQGLATVHDLLSAAEWQSISLAILAEQIALPTLQMLPAGKRISLNVVPSPVFVTAGQAHDLSLLINELTTNAAKYALVNRDRAQIMVNIALDETDHICFEFCDDGPGYPPHVLDAERLGGFELAQNLVKRGLKGELVLKNAPGAYALVRFPAAMSEV